MHNVESTTRDVRMNLNALFFSLLNTLKDPLERGCSCLKATPPSPRPEAAQSRAAQGRRENDEEATPTTQPGD